MWLSHVGVAVIAWWCEVLFHRAWADPTDQVPLAASFVIGAGCTGATEWLLSDNRPGGLVVDVEVACSVA